MIYLFTAIAIGLGLGAGYLIVTSIVFAFIVLLMFGLSFFKKKEVVGDFYIEISYNKSNLHIGDFNKIFDDNNVNFDITRIDNTDESTLFVYSLSLKDQELISKLVGAIKKVEKSATVNLINNNTL